MAQNVNADSDWALTDVCFLLLVNYKLCYRIASRGLLVLSFFNTPDPTGADLTTLCLLRSHILGPPRGSSENVVGHVTWTTRRRPWPLLNFQSVAASRTFHGPPACHWSLHESPPKITQKKKKPLARTISRIDLPTQDLQMLERVQNKTRDAACAAERVAEVTLHQWSLAPPARSASQFYFWILGVLDAATRHGNGALVPVKIEVASSQALLFGQPRRLVCLLQHLIRSSCYTTSTTARPTKLGSFPSAHMPDICLALRRISPRQTL